MFVGAPNILGACDVCAPPPNAPKPPKDGAVVVLELVAPKPPKPPSVGADVAAAVDVPKPTDPKAGVAPNPVDGAVVPNAGAAPAAPVPNDENNPVAKIL